MINPFFSLQPGGGGGHTPQSKNVTLTENGTYVINADEGYDCLSSVTAEVNVSSSGTSVTEKDVNFIDYDGTLLKSYTKEEFMDMDSLPSPPDHSDNEVPLTFDEWNWTLNGIKEQLTAGGKVLVGATYHPTDGKTHIIAEVDPLDAKKIWLACVGTINWGDGTSEAVTRSAYHTYAEGGVYDIVIDGSFTYLGYSSGTSDNAYLNKYRRIYLSENSLPTDNYFCRRCRSLEAITLPKNATYIGDMAFSYCTSLRSIVIPKGVIEIRQQAFQECFSLQNISIPKGTGSLGNSTFYGCQGMKSLIIPEGVTTIGSSTFGDMYSMQVFTIPSTVTTIGSSAFSSCTCSLRMKPTTPPAIQSNTISSYITSIIVPKGSLDAYKAATNWSAKASIIVEEE